MAYCVSRMLIIALSDGFISSIHLFVSVMLCVFVSNSLLSSLVNSYFVLCAMLPSVWWCFISLRPSHCVCVGANIVLIKCLVQWYYVYVDILLHMYSVCMSRILFVILPSATFAHSVLSCSSAVTCMLLGSPSRSWNLLLFLLLRYTISQVYRLGLV